MKLSDLKANLKAEVEGEWVDAPELGLDEATGEPVAFLVRSLHYPPYKMAIAEAQLRLGRRYPGSQLPPPEIEAVENGRLRAKHLLLGWRGIEDDAGGALAFSPETAMNLLTDPEYRPVSDAVFACARVVGTRRADQQQAVAGNSPPGSASS